MTSKQTQIITEYNYNTDNMIFADPQKNTIPDSIPPISYTRINIFTKNPNGTFGDFIIQGPTSYSFGVSESLDQKTKTVNNYSLPLSLWSKDGATKEEKDFTDMIERITDKVRDYLLKNKKLIGKADLTQHSDSIVKLSPLYWKKNEEGERVSDVGPTLYPKLLQKKDPSGIIIYTKFNDMNTDDEVDPQALVKKHFRVIPAIKLESIYIGSKISLQLKVTECLIEIVESGPRRLLKRPPAAVHQPGIDMSMVNRESKISNLLEITPTTTTTTESSGGSLPNSEDESEPAPKKEVEKPPVKAAVRKPAVRRQAAISSD